MEHIKNIEIKNFKSIRHQKIEDCRRINVFIGYPNTGKSNILEALGLYGVVLSDKGEFFRLNEICRVKHFSELFFNQNYRQTSSIILNEEYNLSLSLLNNANTLTLQFAGIKDEDFDDYLTYIVEENMTIRRKESSFTIVNSDTRIPVFPIKKYFFINEPGGINNMNSFSLSFPFGINLLDVLQREAGLRKDIGDVLNSYGFKLLLDTATGSIMLIKEVDESSVLRIPYYQIADTLQRLIFYKAAIVSNRNGVLLFEEPEAHMFPPYMRRFTTDVIFDKTNQFFIATHSPYILDAFMEDAPDDLAIHLVYYEKGETKIKRMHQKEMDEVRAFGVDLFFNLESYLKHGQIDNA